MTLRLHLTVRAADELEAIDRYIAERSPKGARNVQRAMDATLRQLCEFPYLGRRQSGAGLRKFGAGNYPYNIYYLVDDATRELIVVAIRHTSRASEFFDE